MALIPYYDPILDELRARDTATVPDPLIINNLQVASTASINVLLVNGINSSTISTGLLTSNNISNHSTISTNYLYANSILASTVSTGYLGLTRADFNTSYVANGEPIGSLYWNLDRDTLELSTNSGAVQVGEDLFFHCINQTGSQIDKGTAVMYAGALGASGKIKIAPAIADGTYPAIVMLGVTKEDILNGDEGKVLVIGELSGFDNSTFGAEQILYLDPTTPGGFTTTEPSAPNLKYAMAATLDAMSNGNIVVRAIFNPSFKELNDVNFVSLASGQIPMANASGVWANQTLSYTQLTNLPSLGSLAYQNTVDYSQVTNAPSIPSLGSLAVLNTVTQPYLPSNASFNILHTNTIVNASTISTNRLVVTDFATFKAGTVSTPAFNFAQTPSLATTQWEVGWYVDVPFPTVAPWARTLNWTINNTNGGRFADSGLQMASGTGPTGPSYTFLAETQSGMYFDTSTNRPSFTNYGTRSGAFAIGQFIAENGTEVTPSIGFFSETQTGFFLANSANPQIGFTAEGSEIGRFGWTVARNVPRFSINSTSLGLAVLAANQGNNAAAIPSLYLNQVDLDQAFIDLRTTVSAGNPINTTTLGTYYGKFRVEVNGTAKWVGLYN